jgi:hypothetical protein
MRSTHGIGDNGIVRVVGLFAGIGGIEFVSDVFPPVVRCSRVVIMACRIDQDSAGNTALSKPANALTFCWTLSFLAVLIWRT